MSGTQYFIFSILIGGGIAILRFSKIRREYYPFIFLIWLACCNELLNYYLLSVRSENVVNSNVYSLLEGLLYLWFFREVGAFRRFPFMHYLLSFLFISIWITDNFVRSGHSIVENFNSYYEIFHSLTLVMLSITTVNTILLTEKEVVRNPTFLICIGVIVFFTYMILVEAFWIYGFPKNDNFAANVYNIVAWVNLFSNLIFALAILWMRKRQEFTVQF